MESRSIAEVIFGCLEEAPEGAVILPPTQLPTIEAAVRQAMAGDEPGALNEMMAVIGYLMQRPEALAAVSPLLGLARSLQGDAAQALEEKASTHAVRARSDASVLLGERPPAETSAEDAAELTKRGKPIPLSAISPLPIGSSRRPPRQRGTRQGDRSSNQRR